MLPVSVVTQERLQKEACDKGLHPGPAVSRCSCPLGGNASLYLEGSPGPFLWGQRAQGRTGSAPAPWSRGSIGPGSGGGPPAKRRHLGCPCAGPLLTGLHSASRLGYWAWCPTAQLWGLLLPLRSCGAGEGDRGPWPCPRGLGLVQGRMLTPAERSPLLQHPRPGGLRACVQPGAGMGAGAAEGTEGWAGATGGVTVDWQWVWR